MTQQERAQITRAINELAVIDVSLIDFVRETWHIVEPGTPYVDGWHIHAICDHLTAQSNLQIRNLLINMPPRHAKSLLVSVFWPVWEWVRAPHTKWIFASYGQQLSTRDSLKCRRLITHPFFQMRYGSRFKLTSDQSTKTRFDNNKMGYRIATSVGGIGTGEGGDRIVCLTGDTELKLEFGILTIQEVVENKVSGKVASYNKRTQKVEYQQILNWFENDAEELISFHTTNDKTLTCTPEHPIFNVTRNAWIFAKDMQINDRVLCADGQAPNIDKISVEMRNCKVYNIEVGVNNNYYANDVLVHNCDDPHNVLESESEAVRESVVTWWDETMGSRGNNPKTDTRTIVMQRVHSLDLSGHVLQKGGYEHLCLPAEYEKKIFVTSIGFTDPREKEGDLLWPERFDRESIDDLKKTLGTYASAGQLQQRPAPREGGIIKASWLDNHFKITRNQLNQILTPQFSLILQSWDTAFEEGKENDYSVCTTWGYNKSGAYLLDVWRGKPDFPTLTKRAIMLANAWRPNKIIIEKKASGHSLIQTLKKDTQLPVVGVQVKGDKTSRLSAVSGFIESGRVFILEGMAWESDFVDELCMFPAAPHDDQVDSCTHALHELFLKSNQTQVDVRNLNVMGR